MQCLPQFFYYCTIALQADKNHSIDVYKSDMSIFLHVHIWCDQQKNGNAAAVVRSHMLCRWNELWMLFKCVIQEISMKILVAWIFNVACAMCIAFQLQKDIHSVSSQKPGSNSCGFVRNECCIIRSLKETFASSVCKFI